MLRIFRGSVPVSEAVLRKRQASAGSKSRSRIQPRIAASTNGPKPRHRLSAAASCWRLFLTASLVTVMNIPRGFADDAPAADTTAPEEETWAIHGQSTFVDQYHPAFTSPYTGPNSLNPGSRGDETTDMTLFVGFRPWSGAEIWLNPEMDQGFGLSNTLGVAGFPSAEAYKVGETDPYYQMPRGFLRQTIDLGGAPQSVEADQNQLAGTTTANRVVLTIGKYSVVDIFDTNKYAHDPRNDFLNWTIVDAGAFDYAANAWGYTYGATAEWYQDWWTIRTGLFDGSVVPNSIALDNRFISQFQIVTELEERHTLWSQPGKLEIPGLADPSPAGPVFPGHRRRPGHRPAGQHRRGARLSQQVGLRAQSGTTARPRYRPVRPRQHDLARCRGL